MILIEDLETTDGNIMLFLPPAQHLEPRPPLHQDKPLRQSEIWCMNSATRRPLYGATMRVNFCNFV